MQTSFKISATFFCCVILGLAAAQAAEQQDTQSFVYKKTKQADLELVVHYPPGWTDHDKRPAIVFFFGGGWENGTIKAFKPQSKHLASRGMVAARADYRVKSRHGVTPKECVEDAKSAVRWLRANAAKLGIDPDRIVAAGGSAGGHIAACTAFTPGLDAEDEDAKVSSKPNALVLYNPVLRFGPQMTQRIGNDEALAKAISPTEHLTKDSPPTLILFGTADWLLGQGEEFMKKSKELGHRAELFTAEGQPHAFFHQPPWLERTTQRMDEFLVSIGILEGKAASDPPTGTKASFKGWELYVWQQDGDNYFSLLPGTNRLKTDAEIAAAAAKGIDAIKPKLDELKAGEMVFIHGKRLGDGPPNDQANLLREHSRKIGLNAP
ncbi:MAG: alpha/beta hydrolase [Planctomycetota bacterium]|nr:alpha/beta hydrolase [Planctomycetota bacterium]